MPEFVQTIMLAAPTTHFVILAQAILYRGAGLAIVWPQLLALVGDRRHPVLRSVRWRAFASTLAQHGLTGRRAAITRPAG